MSKQLVSRSDSPSGKYSAVIFQRDCGATTSFSTQISILKPGDLPSGRGNTFRADDDHGAAPAGRWGGPWAELSWLAPDHLLIRYGTKSRIFKRAENVGDVKISYESEPQAR
jgi:hypothetical protein